MSPPLQVLGRTSSINVRKVLWACDELGLPYAREDWGIGFQSTQAPAFLAIELGAQAAAAMESMARRGMPLSGPMRGRLVRIRDAQFARDTLPVNTPLDVTAHVVALALPLAVYRVRVCLEGVERATATLSTYDSGSAAA